MRIFGDLRRQAHGIEVVLFAVLGGRSDGPDSFRRTLELADRLKVGVHPVLLTPLPGTALFDQYRPYLMPGLGWEAFTGARAVFSHPHPHMAPERLEAAYHALCRELYRPSRIARRLGGIPLRAFPGVHLLSLMKQPPMNRALRKARERHAGEAHHPSSTPSSTTSPRGPGSPPLAGAVRAKVASS